MKKTKKISFKLVAYTDAAGKYNADAYRSGNEDNFYVDDDLTDAVTNRLPQDETVQLGSLGMLMVVADGMGGMNAGEVASQIAVDTVKTAFQSERLSSSVIATPQSRQKYLEQTIKSADKNVKSEARKDKSREGMGSTIIIAWLFGDELTISWCGDSRAYLFNEKSGIRLISQDHSYVQELVNKGLLTYDQTFDHPQNNIVTRSLGDPTKEAKPDSKTIKVVKGDIILLCSDGLSGVLRDRKTYDSNAQLYPEENIEDILRANIGSMKDCRESLWIAAEKGGWYDNVTVILCQITDGPESQCSIVYGGGDNQHRATKSSTIIRILICISLILALIASYLLGRYDRGGGNTGGAKDSTTMGTNVIDSIPAETTSVETSEGSLLKGNGANQEKTKKESSKNGGQKSTKNITEQVRDQANAQEEVKDEVSTAQNEGLTEKKEGNSTPKMNNKLNEMLTSPNEEQNKVAKNIDNKSDSDSGSSTADSPLDKNNPNSKNTKQTK